jgi:hypothetical protein
MQARVGQLQRTQRPVEHEQVGSSA